ncbi:restriction endonuclease [Microbacterium aurantiacum]|uniref:restriction endonuclease n=1 Tax=Microbacterium aurantiacum TaxID=162393 RepID=UPI003D75F1AE
MLDPEQIEHVLADPSLKSFEFVPELKLRDVLAALRDDVGRSPAWRRKRGYGLERLVYEALSREHVQVRPPTPARRGDQLDGAFVLDGRSAICECKWEAKPISSTKLTQFQAKVDRRLVGTIGVFISASGYAEDSHTYLERGHQLNTVLADLDDLTWAFSSEGSFSMMLRGKIQRAAWDGVVYWRDPEIQRALDNARQGRGVIVVTQGPRDEWLLQLFVRAMGEVLGKVFDVPVLAAYGVYQANALANAIAAEVPDGTKVVAVVDGDGASAEDVVAFWQEQSPGVDVIVAEPTIESWFDSGAVLEIAAARQLYSLIFAGEPGAQIRSDLLRRLQQEHAR